MAIRTFSAQQRYSKNRGEETETKKKLKKLKSVKVANLDRLRLSVRRQKSRFDRSFMAVSDDAGNPSESSPNYMKATSSSSARKGSSSQPISSTVLSSSAASSSDVGASARNFQVGNVRPKKNLKRVTSVKHVKKLSSMKSMKIRAKYSQFQECYNDAEYTMVEVNYVNDDQGEVVKDGDGRKCILKRSRSVKLTKLRSVRYSRRLPKSRLGGVKEQMSYGETSNPTPHYMRGTSSHEARKNSAKGLTRTSSRRPLRFLAKIPSLKPRKNQVRKRPQLTPLYRTGVNRATCSSTLKRTEFPDHIELLSGGRESEGASSVHICPYTYCSLNGHHHHVPSLPIKEFISAKRKSLKNQKEKRLREDVKHVISTSKTDQSRQIIFTEIDAFQMVNPTTEEEEEEEEDGQDFLITVYDKPRKKWAIEGKPSSDSETLTGLTDKETSETDYDWELPEAPLTISEPNGGQEALNEDLEVPQGIITMCDVEANDKNQQEISTTTPNGAYESFLCEEKIPSSGSELINILSDNQKYTNMWHLIYQQFVSSDAPETGTERISGANEKAGGDVNSCHKGNELYQEQTKYSKNLNEDEDNQEEVTENPDFDQNAALKLVQEGLNAMLERDAESVDKQSKPDSLTREYNLLIPDASTRENIKLGERTAKAEMPGQKMSDSYRKLRRIFVTAKIIKAMERMKRISPREPRYLTVEPTLERERVYLRHLSRKESKNTEEWKLDYALRWALSKLGPDQQKRVAQLVEAFETVTPEQRKDIRHYPMKGRHTTGDLPIPVDEEHEQTMNILDEQVNPQQDDESLQSHKSGPEKKQETQEDHTRATDSPLVSSGNSCIPVDIQVYDEGMVKERMSIPEDPSQFSTGDSHTGELTMMFSNKQKYICMWNLIYQQVASSETSVHREQQEDAFYEEEQQGEAIKSIEINDRESNMSSYSINPKVDEDNVNKSREMKESDQSAAVKLVKEALDAILKCYEQSSENQRVKSDTDGSLREDGRHVEKNANPEGDEKLHLMENTTDSPQQQVGPNESKNPLKEKSKSYNRLKKAFVTAKFINAMQRLRINSPQKSQSLPPEAGFKEERVYLRHLSIDGRGSDEECMLDYALRKVISKMAPDQQRRVAQLVEAFETITPQQKEMGLRSYPSRIETAPMARSATNTSVSLKNYTEKVHQRSTSDEQDYQAPQNQDSGVLLSTKDASHERSLEEDHERKASTSGHITLKKTVEAANSETVTELSQISSTLIPVDIATEVSATGVEETVKDAGIVSCFTTGGSEVNSVGDIASILFDKQKYTSMWHLIHQQVVSSEAAKIQKQDINEDDEKECQEINYPDSTQISCMEKVQRDKDSQSAVLNQSAAIKLVKEAIDAILQSHEQRFDQKLLQYDDKAMNRAENHGNPRSEDNLHEEDNKRIKLQENSEEKAAQTKMPNSRSKLKRIFVTAKFIAAMERLKRINWSKPRHLPSEAASVNERVYLRHLSIDGRKNHEEWMLDYALRHVISSLAPDQQRKVASLVGAFETVIPERTRNGFKDQTKDECSPAIEAEPIESEKEIVDSEINSMVYDDHRSQTHGDRLSLNKCAPLEETLQDDCQTDISSIKTRLSFEALDSDRINLDIQHQASSKGCLVQDPLTVRKDAEASIFRIPQHASLSENHQRDFKHNNDKGLFSDNQKTTSMWHLICQHLQSVEGGSKPREGLAENDHMKRDGTSSEMTSDDNYDDNDTDASSVTSELTENDAIKLVKETIDDILEGPQELDNELLSSLSTSSLENDQTTGQKSEKSLSRGYSKLRHIIICNKFIKTMQKMRKIQPQKQMIPALYSGLEAEKVRRKSRGKGEKKDTDEWMLDNVLQKVISELTPAKQRRVALLVEAFEKVNPGQEERGTTLICVKREYADASSLEGNGKENGTTVVESSQNSSESPDSLDLELEGLVTTSNKKLVIDKVPQDISEGRNPSFKKECSPNKDKMKGDTLFTSSDSHQDPTDVSSGDKQGVTPDEMKCIEKHLIGHCDQITKVDKGTFLSEALKDKGNYQAQKTTSLDRGNNTSLWGLILQHAKTDILDKVEMQLSDDVVLKGNSENSSQSSEDIQDKEVATPTPTRHEVYESEAIKLVQEAVNELLTLPEQDDDYQSISSSTISEQAQVETLMNTIATPEDEKPPPNVPNTYSKMSRVIMCRRFIKAMSKMRQLKPVPLQEDSDTIHTETKGSLSLRQTEIGEKKSWEEGMLDHALQQVVGKLAPAQKKRVSLLVQAFETVGSQPEPTAGQRAKAAFW